MDEFKKKLQQRQILLVVGLVIASGALLAGQFAPKSSPSEYLPGFIKGFQAGIIACIFGGLIFFLVRNMIAMRSTEQLKKRYISETDERKLFIRQKSGSEGMNVILFGLALSAAVSGSMNEIVFFSLLGACLFVALVRGFLKVYYRIKY